VIRNCLLVSVYSVCFLLTWCSFLPADVTIRNIFLVFEPGHIFVTVMHLFTNCHLKKDSMWQLCTISLLFLWCSVTISLFEDALLIINYLPWLLFVILLRTNLLELNSPKGFLPRNRQIIFKTGLIGHECIHIFC